MRRRGRGVMRRPRCYFCSVDALIVVLAVFAMSSCLGSEARRMPVRYLVPTGYVGWIKIEFDVSNAPALPVKDHYLVCQIPTSGKLQTSSDIQFGVAKDEYYYYSAESQQALKVTQSGGGGMIWAGFNGQELDANKNVVQTYLQFFVGSEDEYRTHIGPPGPKNAGPIER